MKFFGIAVISLFSMARAQAQDADSADASALVRAMRADVMLLEASRAALTAATSEGYYTDAQLQCFLKLPASAFTADLARILARELTAKEVTQALAFYHSPAGAKFVDFTFVLLNRETSGSFTGKPVVDNPAMTVDEMKAVREFSKTDMGRKLMDDKLLMTTEESQAIAKRVVSGQLTACGAKLPN